MTPEQIIAAARSAILHAQRGPVWLKWADEFPDERQKILSYLNGSLDAQAPEGIRTEHGLHLLDEIRSFNGLRLAYGYGDISYTPPSPQSVLGTDAGSGLEDAFRGFFPAVSDSGSGSDASPAITFMPISIEVGSGIDISALLSFLALSFEARPSFTPSRTVNFTTQTGLNNALADITAGDLIRYNGTGVLTITGNYDRFQNLNPSSLVKIDLGTVASGNYVKFTYTGTSEFDAVIGCNLSKLRIYGGEYTSPNGGSCGLHLRAPLTDVHWWDFVCHDTGADGFRVLTNKLSGGFDTVQTCSFKGECYAWGQNTGWDPHAEAGTGLHGGQFADGNSGGSSGDFKNNVIVLYCHDGNTGAAMEFGNPNTSDLSGNVFYLLGVALNKVATSQVAGNVAQLWGPADFGNTRFAWLEGLNIQGRCMDLQGISSGSRVTLTDQIIVDHGRHENTNQNPNLGSTESGVSSSEPYDDRGGIVYNDKR